ncbi:MAG: hypothetical protein K9M36_00005, partial [Candidatus Pacebacteria bacterium]|nr:hypothetical protein [Candidatus Paceibacterota bacterium]
MENTSAFRPKNPGVEDSTQEKEKKEGPLQSLEKDKAQIFTFNFVLQRFLDGRLTPDIFNLWISPDASFSGDGYLTKNGNYV